MTYEERVQTLIREQYSIADELAILRQRDTKPDEFAAYFEYADNARRRQKSRCNYDWKNTTPEIYGSGAQSGQSLLLDGEVVYESDTGRHKIGDRVNKWTKYPIP